MSDVMQEAAEMWRSRARAAESELAVAVEALERIARFDYRGPEPYQNSIARDALSKLGVPRDR